MEEARRRVISLGVLTDCEKRGLCDRPIWALPAERVVHADAGAAVVAVENAARKVVAINDDDPTRNTLDSKLEWTAPDAGDFRIVATCLNKKFGDFHLTVTKAK